MQWARNGKGCLRLRFYYDYRVLYLYDLPFQTYEQKFFQEIEKLRLEQVEDKRLHNENERVTAQLGRQVAEHRTQSEHLLAETKRLTENLDTSKVGK